MSGGPMGFIGFLHADGQVSIDLEVDARPIKPPQHIRARGVPVYMYEHHEQGLLQIWADSKARGIWVVHAASGADISGPVCIDWTNTHQILGVVQGVLAVRKEWNIEEAFHREKNT